MYRCFGEEDAAADTSISAEPLKDSFRPPLTMGEQPEKHPGFDHGEQHTAYRIPDAGPPTHHERADMEVEGDDGKDGQQRE